MTNYKGRDFLLKIGTWSGGTTVGDCRTHSLQINHEAVDITNKSSNGYRTLLEGWDPLESTCRHASLSIL